MASYKVLIRKSAAVELGRIPKRDLAKIIERIRALSAQPRPHGVEKLSGQERYRIRQGDYRIIFAIDDAEQRVEIFKIGHRSEIYRV
jgi:mRNA interferase RelE/StbE